MMDLLKSRQSVRSYNALAVEDEKLMRLIEAAGMAPSGNNAQPWHFIIVRREATKKALVEADHNQQWMLQAPVFIVCIADVACRTQEEGGFVDEETPDMELKRAIRDTAIAIDHMLLQAESMGLATCWTGWYLQKDIRPILDIPQDKFVLGIVTVGYSDAPKRTKKRKALKELVRYEKW